MQNPDPAPAPAPQPPEETGGTAAPSGLVVALGYVAVALAIAIAVVFVLTDRLFDISMSVKADDFQWFAVLYVVAQALERLLEPLMGRVKATDVKEAKAGVAAAKATAAGETALAAAAEKATAETKLAQVQADRAVIAWAIATALALLVCGALGLGVFTDLANVEIPADDTFSNDFFTAADVVVTGLVIGAGTKPLHDLITRIEKAKSNADPETKPV